jgi:hypothetical protein
MSIWLTSELPVPQRIRDWFTEIPMAGADRAFAALSPAIGWSDIFRALIDKWIAAPKPKIHDIKEVKAFVYEMLMRNLRWVEAAHHLLDAVLEHTGLSGEQRLKAIKILAACDATGGGYTIPSYRIPILWENLFIQLRSALSKVSAVEVDARPKRVIIRRKKSVVKAPSNMA